MANDVCNNGSCGTGGWNGPLPGDPDNSSVLSAVSDYGGIQLSWTVPNINGYAVSYTRIFRSTGNDFATAIPLPPVSGCTFFDRSAAEVIRPYHYWIQNVSVNGTELAVIGPVTATAMPLINQVIQALANSVESSMLAVSLRSRIDKIAELETGLTNTNTTLETETGVLSTELLGLRNDLADAIAYVQESRTIEITERQALVTQLNTQLAQIGSGDFSGLYAAIEEETTTRALETGELFAQKILKFDLAGNVSGYGLSAHLDPDGTSTSDFQVRADTFSLAPPSVVQDTAPTSVYNGKVWVDTSVTPNVTRWYNTTAGAWQTTPVKGAVPFIVKTAPEVIDGFTVPPGVYINSAVISKLAAEKIDTRGLTIKDPDGNIILEAGSSLDWSRLGGAANNLSGLGYTGDLDATRNVYRGTWATAVAYKIGDVVTNSGSSWSALTNHTSATGTNNPPTLPATSNTWWELSAAKGDVGSSGPASISTVLSNEAHVFPATSDGTVSSYTGSGTEIRVYEGATELAYDGVGTANGTWKVTPAAVNITAGTLTDSGTYLTVEQHLGVAAGTDASSITYTITGKTASGTGFTITKAQTFGKSKQGAVGANATSYWLQTSAPAVQKSIAAVYTPASVTYTLMSATGAGSPAVYAGRFIIATSTDGTTYTDQYTSAANESAKAYTVPAGIKTIRVRGYLAGGTTTLVDELITTIVSDGATGSTGAASLSAVMSNEAHVLPAATDGTVSSYTGSGTELRVYEGATELAYDGVGTANGSWKVTLAGTNITPSTSLTDSGTYLTVGIHSGVAAGTDTSSITYTITGKTASGTGFTLTKAQTFTKSKQGAAGADAVVNYVTSEKWEASSSNTSAVGLYGGDFVVNGDGNQRIWSVDPYGRPALLWATINNDAASDADGGWDKHISGVSANKSYISFVYFRRNSASTNGSFYHGCSGSTTLNMSGATDNNPYFFSCGLSDLAQGEWYVSIGIIHANDSSASSNSGVGGVYRLSDGVRVYSGTDYKMSAGATTQGHRTYLYYSTDSAARIEWWSPGFYEINGNEPSLWQITGVGGPVVTVAPNRPTTFTATDGALDASQADITLTASVSGASSPAYVWSFTGFQNAPTNSGVATQIITAAQFGTAKSAKVTCTVNGVCKDDVTIVRLEKSTAAAGATVGAPAGTSVGGVLAETVASKADGALQKAGDAITGPVTFATNGGILAATDANNGVFMGPNGLVGKKAGVTTFIVDTQGQMAVASATTGARMEMKNNVIKVYDSNGVLRVKLGDLTA